MRRCAIPLLLAVAAACCVSARASGSGHLYATDLAGNLYAFALPFTGHPAARVQISVPANTMAASGHWLWAGVQNPPKIAIFSTPLHSGVASSPVFQSGGAAAQLAGDSHGRLYAAVPGINAIQVFDPPYDGATKAAFMLTTDIHAPTGVAVDGDDDLFVGDARGIAEFKAPVTASSSPAVRFGTIAPESASLAFDADGTLYVAHGNAVDVYPPPLAFGLQPTLSIAAPASMTIGQIAISGNAAQLFISGFVGTGSPLNGIYVYALPLNAASQPIARFHTDQSGGLAAGE